MSTWNAGQSIIVSAGKQPMTREWQFWVAENLLLGVEPRVVEETLRKNGFDQETAARALRDAMNHPYLHAARRVQPGAKPPTTNADAKIKKRDWVLEVYRRSARLASTHGQVPRVHKPSRQEFLDQFYAQNRPVLIEGAMEDWPALKRWTPEYLKRRLGERIVEVQANRNTDPEYEISSNKLKKEMKFGDYVDLVETIGSTNDYYITANNSGKNKDSLKELWEDIVLFPDYLREDDPKGRGFFWYGPQGTVTPLHHDLTNNFMAQVRGRKLVRLIAPFELPHVYNHRHCFSRIDLERIDYAAYPEFRNATVVDVELRPGELLFLPVGWWHHVRGLDIAITMTFTNFVFENDFYSWYTSYGEI